MMTMYKKALIAVALIATISTVGFVFAEEDSRCPSCAEKMAIRQSVQEALAAALQVSPEKKDVVEKCNCGKPRPPRSADQDIAAEDDSVDAIIEKCGCGKPKPKPAPRPSGRAADDAE